MKKRGSEGKDFVPWEELDSMQLAKQIQKYPTGVRPQSFKSKVKLKVYKKWTDKIKTILFIIRLENMCHFLKRSLSF